MKPTNDAILIQLVAECFSIREIIRRTGSTYTGSSYMQMKRRIEKLDLDTKHFIFKPRTYTNEELKTAVKETDCLTNTIRELNMAVGGGTRKNLWKQIEKLGIDTSHFKHRKKTITPLEEMLILNSSFKNYDNLKKRIIKELGFEVKCHNPKCGITHWLGESVPLELDHINGNRKDNRIENLRLLCSNCHRLTPTWGGKKIKYLASLKPNCSNAK